MCRRCNQKGEAVENWKRQWKIDLIEKENIDWIDLSSDWNY